MSDRKPPALVLAFDVGTSSLRTSLFTTRGDRLPETTAQETYPLRYTPDGGAELAPAVLIKTARHCLGRTLLAQHENSRLRRLPVVGVGMSCFWHSLVGLDGAGRPITPIYTWADSRSRGDAAALRKELGEPAVHARTGCMLRSSFWPAKLAWLRRTDPGLFARVRKWISPAELLRTELAGATSVGLSMASGTGLFNALEMTWDAALLDRCGIDAAVALNAIDEEPAYVPRARKGMADLEGVPWFPALGDGAASNLGCGATEPGLAAINVGTSAALRVLRTKGKPVAPFGLFCYRVDAARFLVGGAVSNAGNLRAWSLRELGLDDAELERAMRGRPTPEHGLLVLPFWSAERAPAWEEDRRGLIHGLTQNTTALDMLQAITEASYYRIARIAALVLKQEKTPPKFIVSGGIQRSASSLQRLADVLNQPVYRNDEREASIRGAAVYVLERLGYPVPPARLPKPIRPNAAAAERYAAEHEKQKQLEKLTASFHG